MVLSSWGAWVTPWDVFANFQSYDGIPYPVMHFLQNVTIPINNMGSTNPVTLALAMRNGATDLAKEAYYAQGLSYLINHYLPYLPLENQSPFLYVNTNQFSWPPASDGSWSGALSEELSATFIFQQEHGL